MSIFIINITQSGGVRLGEVNLKKELTLMLEKEVGFTGKFILEKQCQNLNIDPENINYEDLEPLAGKVKWALKNYIGEKRADEIQKGMLEYSTAMDVVHKANKSNYEDLQQFTFKHIAEADITIALKKLDLGLHAECLEVLKRARTMLEKAEPEEAKILDSRISRLMGRVLSLCNSTYDEAIEEYQRSITTGTGSNVHYDVALSWNGIAGISWHLGRYDDALEYYRKALDTLEPMPTESRNQKNKKTSANALIKSGMGRVYLEQKDYESSAKFSGEAIELYRSIDNFAEAGRVSINLARANEESGNYSKAIDGYNEAITLCTNSGALMQQGWALTYLANALIESGRTDEARAHLEKADKILGNFADPVAYSKLNCTWGKYHREKGQWSDGIERFQRSIDVVSNAKAPDHLAIARAELGALFLRKGDGQKALESLQIALGWYKDVNDKKNVIKVQDMIHRSGGFNSGLI
jgi:tetratricopeptide (TPR) repeat protein